MRPFFDKLKDGLAAVLVVVFLILASPFIFVWLIIKTIRDYFSYKKSLYYKDTKEKYSWLCSQSEHITFYNAIKAEKLPIDFYRDKSNKATGCGYFVYGDVLILCDYDSDIFFFDNEREEWFVNDERDCVLLENAVYDEIEKANKLLGDSICKRAFLFVEKSVYDKARKKQYENIEFLITTDRDRISVLKNML